MLRGVSDAVAPLTAAAVAAWRRRFPVLATSTYLINNSLGAMPDTVPASLASFASQWATKGVEAWGEDWLPEVRRVADLVGTLIGAPAGTVVVHGNVATLMAMLLSALPLGGPRRKVVLADIEWPGHHYLLERYAARGLVDVEVVETDGVHVDGAQLAEAVDEQTLLVTASHVIYRSACIVDVELVCARARAVGAYSVVDGYHATGHMPVDVGAIGCDAYVGGSVKWLCGGPGVGYAYIRPDSGLAPRDVGWLGHARPFDFVNAWEPAEGALAWFGGTPSIPALYAAREGYRIIAEVGQDRIRATSQPLTARLVDGATEAGWRVRTPRDAERRGGSVTIDLGEQTAAVARRLIDAGVIVDHRPGAGIRVGPHFFNTLEECDHLLETMAAAAG